MKFFTFTLLFISCLVIALTSAHSYGNSGQGQGLSSGDACAELLAKLLSLNLIQSGSSNAQAYSSAAQYLPAVPEVQSIPVGTVEQVPLPPPEPQIQPQIQLQQNQQVQQIRQVQIEPIQEFQIDPIPQIPQIPIPQAPAPPPPAPAPVRPVSTGNSVQQLQPTSGPSKQVFQAPISSKHSVEVKPVQNEFNGPTEPQIIEVQGGFSPVELLFRTKSSTLKVRQQHKSQPASQVEASQSSDEPYRLVHSVTRPVIQEVREIIQPYRKVVQQIQPVQEQILTLISKKEGQQAQAGQSSGGGVQNLGSAGQSVNSGAQLNSVAQSSSSSSSGYGQSSEQSATTGGLYALSAAQSRVRPSSIEPQYVGVLEGFASASNTNHHHYHNGIY